MECSTFEGTPKGRLHDCAVQGDVQTAPQVTVGSQYLINASSPLSPDAFAAIPPENLAGVLVFNVWVAVGDRVIVRMRHGGYTDEAVIAPAQLTPLPSNFDYAEGATFLSAHGSLAFNSIRSKFQRVVTSFPSVYQTLPNDGSVVDTLRRSSWARPRRRS